MTNNSLRHKNNVNKNCDNIGEGFQTISQNNQKKNIMRKVSSKKFKIMYGRYKLYSCILPTKVGLKADKSEDLLLFKKNAYKLS